MVGKDFHAASDEAPARRRETTFLSSALDYLSIHLLTDRATVPADRIRIEDREGLVSFFKDVMNWPGFEHAGSTSDYWDWKYLRKPGPKPIGYASWHYGKAISHASIVPTQLMVDGRAVAAGQLGDMYTHPDHRGNGLAESMLERVERQADADGIEIVFAFPSEAGGRIIAKRGYQELPISFAHYHLITNLMFFERVSLGPLKKAAYKAMMMTKAPGRRPIPGMVAEVTDLPDDIDDMTQRFEAQFDLVLRHDRRYLEWRYGDPHGGAFRTLLATVDGRTVGLAVLRPYFMDGAGYMDIVDLMADPDHPQAARGLVAQAIEMATAEGIVEVQSWVPSDHPLVPFLLRAGFMQRTPLGHERRLRMFCHPGDGHGPASVILQRPSLKAHIMLGDTDWI